MDVEPDGRLNGNERDQLAIRQEVMRTFGEVARTTGLSPMLILQYAAAGLGSVYREVAESHRTRPCPCGWIPDELNDVSTLQMAMAAEALSGPQLRLAVTPALGHG